MHCVRTPCNHPKRRPLIGMTGKLSGLGARRASAMRVRMGRGILLVPPVL